VSLALEWVKRMVKTINAWRGLLALTVVLFHANWVWIWDVACSGVTFFFIASSFLLSMRHPFDRLTPSSWGRFALNHAMRLYPLQWLGLLLLVLLALAFHVMEVNGGLLALNVLLLQAWSPVHEVHYSINSVTWYLSALLFCYLCYPLMSHVLRRWRLRYKVALIAVLVVVLGAILLPLDIPGREAVFVNPLSHIVDFTVGIALFHVYTILRQRCSRVSYHTATIIEVAAVMLLVIAVTINKATTWVKPWEDNILWMLPHAAIILSCALLNGQEGALGRLLLCRPLQWLGDISFEVYVLQNVAFLMCNYMLAPVFGHFGINVYGISLWFAVPLLIVMAWVVNRVFTRPVRRWLRGVLPASN